MDDSGGAEATRTPAKEDRLSALPDSLIHQVLSFLPSTKQAIQTGILSKRWLNQWTFVSNLIFDFSHMSSKYPLEDISFTTSTVSTIVDQTLLLHQCAKIQKFQIITDLSYEPECDPTCEDKILVVVGKQVEELILNFFYRLEFRLPEFFFTQPRLVKLQLSGCSLKPAGMVNWRSLLDFSVENCSCSCEVITSIVSGSPLLRSLEVVKCDGLRVQRLVIASASLKRLVEYENYCYVDISCPNLVEFEGQSFGWCDKVLEKFFSDSPLLESLELKYCIFSNVRIASEVMKKFVFKGHISNEIAITCPHLEELGLCGGIQTIKLMNLPSSVQASLNLRYCEGSKETSVKQILEGVQHVNELKFGSSFIEALSNLEMYGVLHPLLKSKSLTLEGYLYGLLLLHIPGIAYALCSLPLLERLVVKLQAHENPRFTDLSVWDRPEANYWNSNGTHFSSLVSHLKTVKIIGFSQREYEPKVVLDFVEFLLKNASTLEKMVVVLEDCGIDFVIKVSQKLLSFPRCSTAIIDFVCPN